MTPPADNPFVRCYDHLCFQRILQITYEDDCPPCYRPLHSTQADLPDTELTCFPCTFNDDFALISEGQVIADELDEQCPHRGIVRQVLYTLTGEENGQPVFIGDVYSAEQACTVVQRLRFETGIYSRSWEISTQHLPEPALQRLRILSGANGPVVQTGVLVEFFFLADCDGLGCKLILTPWTDQNLTALRQEQLDKGLPTELLDILHLAAQADVRFLVFDPHARVLDGLPVFPG